MWTGGREISAASRLLCIGKTVVLLSRLVCGCGLTLSQGMYNWCFSLVSIYFAGGVMTSRQLK